jgi:hypothetical protein
MTSKGNTRLPGTETVTFIVMAIAAILTIASLPIYMRLLDWQVSRTLQSCDIASNGSDPSGCYMYMNWVVLFLALAISITTNLFINACLFCIVQAAYDDWDDPARKYMGYMCLRFAVSFVVCALAVFLAYQYIDLIHPWMPTSELPTRPAGSLPITTSEYV